MAFIPYAGRKSASRYCAKLWQSPVYGKPFYYVSSGIFGERGTLTMREIKSK
jgi:hypothetical protein